MNLQKQLRCVYLHAFTSTLRFTDAVWVALLAARGSVAVDEHAIATPGSGPRIVTARHVPINGPGGEPMFVLSLTEDRTSRVRQESRPDIRPLRRFSAAG